MWSHSLFKSSPAQILYIFTRYSPFLCHAGNIAFLELSERDPPIRVCRHWLFFSTATVAWIYGLLLFILMLRVYALFRLDYRIIIALAAMICFKVANLVLCWLVFIPSTRFSPTCKPFIDDPAGMFIFTIVELVVQGIPVYLTLSRCAKIEHLTHTKRIIDLVANLRRQGMLCWSSITVFSSIVIAFMAQAHDAPSPFPHISYPLFITILSAANCRFILQMGKPSMDSGNDHLVISNGISFALDSCDSPWDTTTFDSGAGNVPSITPRQTCQPS